MISGGVVTEDEFGTWASLDTEALGANGHATVGADLDWGAKAPNKRPPRALGYRAEPGAFFLEGQGPSLVGFHLKFSVDLVLVAMPAEVLDMGIGLLDVDDLLAGEVGR